jgi:hypothetical protein
MHWSEWFLDQGTAVLDVAGVDVCCCVKLRVLAAAVLIT